MQKVLQDKQISGFELGFLVESGVRKSPATAVTAPGDGHLVGGDNVGY